MSTHSILDVINQLDSSDNNDTGKSDATLEEKNALPTSSDDFDLMDLFSSTNMDYESTSSGFSDADTPDYKQHNVFSPVYDSNSNNTKDPYQFSDTRSLLHPTRDIVEELMPEEIRWFFRDYGEKRWRPFIGYDSLRLETKYRELKSTDLSVSLVDLGNSPDSDSNRERILVRGGLYEVDVKARQCVPIYWSFVNQYSAVLRGSWFLTDSYEPVAEDFSDAIELEHMKHFGGTSLTESEDNSQNTTPEKQKLLINTLQLSDRHVEWYHATRVFLYKTASKSLYIREKLGMKKVGTPLMRGYQTEAALDDKLADVTHLCFVIHGIGQKMRTGSIVKCCSDLRTNCNQLKERYFPDLDNQNERVEFLPVEWRSSLRLDGDTVDSITPGHLRGLRTLLNTSAMDIMYYTSPMYRTEITQGLQTELNRLYSMYCSRHPYFNANGGSVSIIAHSLGCVITYDIVMGWNPLHPVSNIGPGSQKQTPNNTTSKAPTSELAHKLAEELEKTRKKVNELELALLTETDMKKSVDQQPLTLKHANFPTNFKRGSLWRAIPKISNFFCLGSPLAVFLALRGVRPSLEADSANHILPQSVCSHLFNVYHPADPIAYRLEPLVHRHYEKIQPQKIHRYDTLNKAAYASIRELDIKDKSIKKEKLELTVKLEKMSTPPTKSNEFFSNFMTKFHTFMSSPQSQCEENAQIQDDNRSNSTVPQSTDASNSEEVVIAQEPEEAVINASATPTPQQPSESRLTKMLNNVKTKWAERKVKAATSPDTNDPVFSDIKEVTDTIESDRKEMETLPESTEIDSDIKKTTLLEMADRAKLMKTSGKKYFSDSLNSLSIQEESIQNLESLSVELEDLSILDHSSQQQENFNEVDSIELDNRPESVFSSENSEASDQTPLPVMSHRLDYQLQESRYESSYLSALTSHTAYWTNQDLAMFIMTQLFSSYGPIGIPKK